MSVSQPNKLRRSRHDRIIAGVCSGIANFFGIDTIWVRILFVILLIPGGFPGLITYLALWLIVPLEE